MLRITGLVEWITIKIKDMNINALSEIILGELEEIQTLLKEISKTKTEDSNVFEIELNTKEMDDYLVNLTGVMEKWKTSAEKQHNEIIKENKKYSKRIFFVVIISIILNIIISWVV